MTERRRVYLLLAISNLLGFSFLVMNEGHLFAAGADWNAYFEPLSLWVRSSVWHYHQFPLHNPWRCGGSDFLINPQTRIFSPLGLLDVLLTPQWACLASLMIYGFLGMIGMFFLLEYLGLSLGTATVGALLFGNSSWLSLHFAEGHITYGDMQLLPFVFYCGLQLDKRRIQFALLSVLALILLDGAIQPFVFAGMILACSGWVRRHWGKPGGAWDYRFTLKLSGIFLLLTSIKIIPVMMTLHGRMPMLDRNTMSPRLVFMSFWYPWQKIRMAVTNGLPFSFHEYGCYLGWTATGLMLSLIYSKQGRSKVRPFLALFAFWFWIGTGWGGKFNPWSIFQKIPLVNQAHLQSRTFIIMFIFFVILVSKALDVYRPRRAVWILLSLLLIVESTFVRFHTQLSFFEPSVPALRQDDLIRNSTLTKTVADGVDIAHYFKMNTSATNCNERSYLPSSVLPRGHRNYAGEVFIQEGKGDARLREYLPGMITVNYRTQGPAVVALNTNNLWGWKASDPQVEILSRGIGDLVRVRVPGGEGTVVLSYDPIYFYPCLFLFLVGCLWYLREAKKLYQGP
ncbi:hypothetical protein WDW37_13545 [Bdellovibrionota bacterium FG-1]